MTNEFVSLWGLAVVWAMGVMLPGPNFIIVVKNALSRSPRQGVLTALGVSSGAVVWATGTLLGLHALFLAFSWLYGLLKVLGGVYLVYVGLRILLDAWKGGADAKNGGLHAMPGYRAGVLTSLSNPKTAAFFGSVFVTVMPAQMSASTSLASVVMIFVISVAWYSFVALAFSFPVMQRLYDRIRRPFMGCMGAVLALLGGRLVLAED